ncbi:DUF1345 domain-containing protein [Flavobacterium album]|uniref:DUF1345 domain-containing protein n=1 Tax=Flavobacterium album TaxID=2175091 RepID=A0A2S1R1E1_9FLAO|nr:DUF1345 domain-containing protein [Flavobacterium album]AWH86399.1 DUF1345 domain-containing protein [Flavobacterium album]
MDKRSQVFSWIFHSNGYRKLLVSLIFALACSAALLPFHLSLITRIMAGWDVFALAMTGMMWFLFCTTTAAEQKRIVKKQDDNISTIFAIVLTAVCISFSGALLLIFNNDKPSFDNSVSTIVTLIAIGLSWILFHTIFTVRYAHLYHDDTIIKHENGSGGINFPNPDAPDYIDFAYFSFVIGMTFQVSDVTISSKTIRRFVLLHSLISFVFNTIIVALVVNIIAGSKIHG